MKRLLLSTFLIGAFVLLAAACGGTSAPKPDITIDIKAENMHFVPDHIEVPAGKIVMIRMQNMDANEHDFEIGGMKGQVMGRTGMTDKGMDMNMSSSGMNDTVNMHSKAKDKASVTFKTDQKGTFDFYCTVTGHKESGMVGKITVS